MKNLFLTFILSLVTLIGFSQTPQIAVVKPNGSTTIHSTWYAAYDASSDDDYIYLPGGQFNTLNIDKRLHIIGSGYNEDSTQVTGITKLQYIIISQGAQGGSIEGIKFTHGTCGSIVFDNNGGINSPSNYSISNCFIKEGVRVQNNITWSNLNIRNCVIGSQPCYTLGNCSIVGTIYNSFFTNNIILSHICGSDGLDVSNNLFFIDGSLNLNGNSLYNNNIFSSTSIINTNDNIFHNSANCNPTQNQNNQNFNNIIENFDQIFINPGNSPYLYEVHNDYHVKPTSGCKNSGTDGTDRGIYGGAFPWKDGSIPSNPHIYFKNVAGTTNPSGQLQVQFKVRTGN